MSVSDQAVRELEGELRGRLIQPGGEGYDDARRVWNGMIDRHPSLIVRCAGTADVIRSVNFARKNDLLTAIRGGGHNVAGSAVCDDGLVIDLTPMRGARVDILTKTVRVAGGATWGDVDAETQAFGLAAPGGVVSTTGVAGLTLGGGLGHLRRTYGLACDNLVSADVVTADGQVVIASELENPDLLWALRGGGGNFGVVTSFEFSLHPVGPPVFLAAPAYPAENAARTLRRWREFLRTVPDEVNSLALFWSVPAVHEFPSELHGRPILVIAALYAGPAEKGAQILQPIRELDTPVLDLSGVEPFTVLQKSFDPFFTKPGTHYYWKSLHLNSLGDEVIDDIASRAVDRPSPRSTVDLWHFGGAMSRVRPEATAFGRRDAPFMLGLSSGWENPADSAKNIAWTRDFWSKMQRHSDGGLYLNFPGLGEEGEQLVRRAYGGNYERLVDVKTKYDPLNLFRVNQNIKPRAS